MGLEGKRIAVLVENGYQDLEFWYPKIRLTEEGARVVVVGKDKAVYRSEHGYEVQADLSVADLKAKDFDAVIVPGGVACPDRLRRHKEILNFVREMYEEGKIVAAICHGPWVLISAGIVKGKEMTCFFSIKDDVVNAGASYADEAVVVDGSIITSRRPDDLPHFCKAIINVLQK